MIGPPRGWENTTHAALALPAADTLQGFVIQDDQTILASQGVGPGEEDTHISKLNPDGSLVGTMVAVDAGHGTILGHHGQDRIIFDWQAALVTTPWRPGAITRGTPGVVRWGGSFQGGNRSAIIDRKYGTAGFYDHDSKIVTLRHLQDVETQSSDVIGRAGPLTNKAAGGTEIRFRQGWAIYNRQLFYLIGDHDGGQELISYSLVTGNLLWRVSAKLCGNIAWQEPEGLWVSDLGVITGPPMIYVGFTNRVPDTSPVVRQHVIQRLKDPTTILAEDLV